MLAGLFRTQLQARVSQAWTNADANTEDRPSRRSHARRRRLRDEEALKAHRENTRVKNSIVTFFKRYDREADSRKQFSKAKLFFLSILVALEV